MNIHALQRTFSLFRIGDKIVILELGSLPHIPLLTNRNNTW